jgi:hypothetical protein
MATLARNESAVLYTRIICPIFYHTTVNTNFYLNIFREYVNQLDEWKLRVGYSKKYGRCVTRLTGPWQKMKSFFRNRIILEGFWPPQSPDIIQPDFFLLGLQNRLNSNFPRTIYDLKWKIT